MTHAIRQTQRPGTPVLEAQEQVYVTTAIPYVNARPHIGFGLELVLADAIARSQRLLGCRARLQTGTDDNAAKNVEAARLQGVETRRFVDGNARFFRQLAPALGGRPDAFVRTSEVRHHRAVQALWRRLDPDDLYRRRYRGRYCSGCEDFLSPRDLQEGCCPDHGTRPAAVEEENLFFRLSRYQKPVEALLQSGRLEVIPHKRRREILAFVRGGLQDISVSRPKGRAGGWGVEVPGHADQTVYVWIDALVNYLTGLGFGEGGQTAEWWGDETRKVHVIGKNIWKFHALYWPALLLSAGLPLPDQLVVHGFVTQNGRKISKSRGRPADPLAYAARYGGDALRYYLLKLPLGEDGDFGDERLALLYRTDLANGLGNLCGRVTALAVRAGIEEAPPPETDWPAVSAALARYRFDRALDLLWRRIGHINRDIDRVRPWQEDVEDVRPQVAAWLGQLGTIGHWLAPLLPTTSQRLAAVLGQRPLERSAPLFPQIQTAGERT